jgi:FKBP-type peptidyl-prolyl cis-trans isomerase FkpA
VRALLFLVPALLLAQAPAPKPTPNTKAKPGSVHSPRPASAKPAAAKPKPAAAPPAAVLSTDDDKIVYSLGLSIARSLAQFDLSPHELEIVKQALSDAAAGKPAVELNEWGPKIEAFSRARAARVTEAQKAASKVYLEKAAAEPGAIRTESGLVYREITPGAGAHPKDTDTVKVNYRGTLIDGTEFDSSYKRNQPAEFRLNGVIRCWTEGVQKMAVGGKSVLVCPSDLAYGDAGRPSIPGGAALVFEVELLDIVGGSQ